MGVNVEQGWGMTETSPIVTSNLPWHSASAALTGEDAIRQRLKQGRAACGTDMKIVDADWWGTALGRQGVGDFLVRGHWVAREYLNRGAEGAADPDGWFRTGDVCTVRPGRLRRDRRPLQGRDQVGRRVDQFDCAQKHRRLSSHRLLRLPSSAPAIRNGRSARFSLSCRAPARISTGTNSSACSTARSPKWWLPDDVVVVEELPHTATGKLNKLALRARFQDYLLQPQKA